VVDNYCTSVDAEKCAKLQASKVLRIVNLCTFSHRRAEQCGFSVFVLIYYLVSDFLVLYFSITFYFLVQFSLTNVVFISIFVNINHTGVELISDNMADVKKQPHVGGIYAPNSTAFASFLHDFFQRLYLYNNNDFSVAFQLRVSN